MHEYISKINDPTLSIDQKESKGETIVFDAVLGYNGSFVDKNGTLVDVTEEDLEAVSNEYNTWVASNVPNGVSKTVKAFYGKKVKPHFAPIITDHEEKEVDRVMGKVLSTDVIKPKDGGKTLLTGKLAVSGSENHVKIYDGRLSGLSMGLKCLVDEPTSFCDYGIRETSFVVSPAMKGAAIILSEGSKEKEKLKITDNLANIKKDVNALAHQKTLSLQQGALKRSDKHLKPKLAFMVKNNTLSKAASLSIYEELKEKDKKTQDIVLGCLQTTKNCPIIPIGHLADIQGSLRTDQELNKLGIQMKKTDKQFSTEESIANLKQTATATTAVQTDTDKALAALKEQALKFSEETTKRAELVSVVKEANEAIKSGNSEKAQILLGEYLGEEPEEKGDTDKDDDKTVIRLSELEANVKTIGSQIDEIVTILAPKKETDQ